MMLKLAGYLLSYSGGYKTIRQLAKKKMRKVKSLWHGGCCRLPYLKYKANNTACTENFQTGEKKYKEKGCYYI